MKAIGHGMSMSFSLPNTIMMSHSIEKILEHQMNIKIKNVPARVHISEIVDDITEVRIRLVIFIIHCHGHFCHHCNHPSASFTSCMQRTNPMDKYKAGDEVKVKVIGFREVKGQGYLPITSPIVSKAIPECTLKPRWMSAKVIEIDTPCSAAVAFIDTLCRQQLHLLIHYAVQQLHLFFLNGFPRSKLGHTNLKPGEDVQSIEFQVGDTVNAFVTKVIESTFFARELFTIPVWLKYYE